MNNLHITPGLKVYSKSEAKIGFTTGKCIGTVDHFDGEQYIKLKKNGSADGKHHWFPLNWVSRVDEKLVYLHKTQEEFWRDRLDVLPPDPVEKKAV